MDLLVVVKLVLFFGGSALVVVDIYRDRHQLRHGISATVLTVLAIIFILFIVYLWINHISFPLYLGQMEGVIWQHFQRAASFQAVYPQPSPEFVPFAYNPLYYVLAVPFSWVFGVNLFTLRLVAILGMTGSGLILYLVVSKETGSSWWGLMAVGLFAVGYNVMDAYLDSANADSWLLFSALLGSYLIYRNRSRKQNLLGVVLLVSAFWFKQHGALFAIGGLLYLTWREGLKGSLIYWITAILLGPLAYIFVGPSIFGPYFHYFTWTVPQNWSELHFHTFRRYFEFIARNYLVLAFSGGLWVLWRGIKERKRLNIWHFQFILALLTGLMGSLDPGSSNNVYIPMGIWFIMCGTIALHEGVERIPILKKYRTDQLGLYITLACFIYNPLSMIIPAQAVDRYDELISMLRSLDGPVYAPQLGQLQQDFKFYPAASSIALGDMIRGPGRDTSNNPNTRLLTEPAIHPSGSAYILVDDPLDKWATYAFLGEYYTLDKDFSDRFKPLRSLPKRWGETTWPRYLYRFTWVKTVP